MYHWANKHKKVYEVLPVTDKPSAVGVESQLISGCKPHCSASFPR